MGSISDPKGEGHLIKRFDPWRNPLCTCPPKYSLSPYTGCGHSCAYCYITSYVPQAFRPRAKHRLTERVRRDLEVIDRRMPILLSASSDPYTPMECSLRITREVLRMLAHYGARFMVQTKSDMVLRDIDIISSAGAVVGMTVTTADSVAAKLEPNAPSPRRRLEALNQLSRNGIPTIARIDPIIPGVNDRDLPELIGALASSGVVHIVASTFKARPDGLRRLEKAIPESSAHLESLYMKEGRRISNCMYLDGQVRRKVLARVRSLVLDKDMTFATCREGIDEFRTSPSCDGTHLILK